MPWIYLRREELGLSGADVAFCEGVYRFAWMANQRLVNAAVEVAHCLREHGIDVLVLKGLSLLADVYGDVGGRYMEDFDLMIRPEDVDRAVTVLAPSGWRPQSPETFSPEMRSWRHSEELRRDDGLSCDVHWRLLRRPNEPVDEAPLWAARREIALRGEPVFTLSVEHMLVHLLGHGFSWQRVPAIRWILDMHLLLKQYAPDWRALASEVHRRGIVLPVAEALAVYDKILPGQIPRSVLDTLVQLPATRRERVAYEQLTRPYEKASWKVIWEVYRADLERARLLGVVQPGWKGTTQHLCLYWRAESIVHLPWIFARKLIAKIGWRRGS
jgi:hypothetical protein